MKSRIFTPNVQQGCGNGIRYKLYLQEGTTLKGVFSLADSPNAPSYPFVAERDDCGLGCKCGAFITSTSDDGRDALTRAVQIDSQNHVVKSRIRGERPVVQAASADYRSLGKRINIQVPVESLSRRDQIALLDDLMNRTGMWDALFRKPSRQKYAGIVWRARADAYIEEGE